MTEKMDQVQGFYLETQEFREARQATSAEYDAVNKRKRVKNKGTNSSADKRINVLAERDGWICALCGEPIDPSLKGLHPMRATRDHIIPRSEKGSNALSNLQLAHSVCNGRRGNASLDWFKRYATILPEGPPQDSDS